MTGYKLSPDGLGVTRSDGVSFALSAQNNRDAEGFQEWLALGNTPDPADQVSEVISVTPWQMREALNQSGLRAAVESAVAASSQEVHDGWEFAQELRSDNALIASVAEALGKTPNDVSALFALAKSLTL